MILNNLMVRLKFRSCEKCRVPRSTLTRSGVVAHDRVLSMGQIEVNYVIMLECVA